MLYPCIYYFLINITTRYFITPLKEILDNDLKSFEAP
jgi:hypothetical protein